MKILENSELELAHRYFNIAREEALKSDSYGLNDGAVIIKGDLILGRGFDSFNEYGHAEKKAIEDVLSNFDKNILKGSTLYLTRINGNKSIIPTGLPSCTSCSKLILNLGIKECVLFQEMGFYKYTSEEYNDLTLNFEASKLKSL